MLRSLLFALTLASLGAAQALPPACPTDARLRLLRESPTSLDACAQSADPIERVWAAHAARAEGRPERARALYESAAGDPALSEARPALLLAAARAAGAAGDPAGALALLSGIDASRRWLRAEAAAAQADLALQAGDPAAARTAAQFALRQNHPAADSLRGVLARAALQEKDAAAFSGALRELETENPDSVVTAVIERLAPPDGRPVLMAADWARRWARWNAHGGASGVAEECLAQLGRQRVAPAADLARARLECGRALSTLRRPEATRLFEQAAEERTLRPQALLALARVQSRSEDPLPVQATCQAIAKAKAKDELAECSFLAGFMQLNRGHRTEAQSALEEVIKRFPRHPRASDAAWFLAFDAFRNTPAKAAERFDGLVQRARDATERAQALYWRARARPAEEREKARSEWTEVVQLDPLGFYGWLASARLGAAAAAPTTPDGCARSVAGAGTTPPPAARRVQLLLALGFQRAAGLELMESLSPRQRSSLEWTSFLVATEQFERLLDVGVAQGGQGGPWPADAERQPAIEAAFPRAFPDALSSAPSGVDRCLLLSLMRRESRFNPEAASAAQARGLLQLLPKTVDQLARELGESAPPPEHLHDPKVNLHFAGTYVQRLSERFRNPLLVAAAYNAGPNAVARWTSDMAGVELDEWIERIPYRETRAYVKAVGGAYAAYSLIYTGIRPPLALAPIVAPGPGIEY